MELQIRAWIYRDSLKEKNKTIGCKLIQTVIKVEGRDMEHRKAEIGTGHVHAGAKEFA